MLAISESVWNSILTFEIVELQLVKLKHEQQFFGQLKAATYFLEVWPRCRLEQILQVASILFEKPKTSQAFKIQQFLGHRTFETRYT